jgi:hypothetical protein
MDRETAAMVEAALPQAIVPELVARVAPEVDRAVRARFPLAHGPRPEAVGDARFYGGGDSGARWLIVFDAQGQHVMLPALNPDGEGDTVGFRKWDIALSCRVPVLAWSERVQTGALWEVVSEADPALIAWANALAQQFELRCVDAEELWAWKVDPQTLTEEMWMRLDYTDDPSAFQLLFYE